jgi:uncharacterized DUF497 family protein
VDFEFDSAKEEVNLAKHGVSQTLAEVLFAGRHVSVQDDRFDYGEVRQVAFGRIRERLFVCVFVDRGSTRRVISFRKANSREVKRHGEKIEQGRG